MSNKKNYDFDLIIILEKILINSSFSNTNLSIISEKLV